MYADLMQLRQEVVGAIKPRRPWDAYVFIGAIAALVVGGLATLTMIAFDAHLRAYDRTGERVDYTVAGNTEADVTCHYDGPDHVMCLVYVPRETVDVITIGNTTRSAGANAVMNIGTYNAVTAPLVGITWTSQ